MITPRVIHGFVCFAILPSLLLTATAAGTDTNSLPQGLAVRVEKACAENKIDDKLTALVTLGKTLALSEIPDAIKTAENLEEMRERVVLTESVLKRWGELAPAEAFAYISKMPEGMIKEESLRGVVPLYARQDIQAVAAAALKMSPGRARTETVQILVEEWTRQDVKAVLEWVDALPVGFPKDGALHNIYFIWVHLDPAGIASTVRNLPPGGTRNALIINVAGDWAATDAASAIQWAEELPVEADRQTALATVAESWADVDPVAAADFARKLSPPELRQRAVLAAVTRWATQDPEQALSWITNVQDVALQQQGVAKILNIYVPVFPEAAGQRVDQLLPGGLRESSIETYVEAVRIWNPGAGARLALKTADPVAREKRVHACFRTWLAWDPDAAKQWLTETDFSDAVKNRWLSEKADSGF